MDVIDATENATENTTENATENKILINDAEDVIENVVVLSILRLC